MVLILNRVAILSPKDGSLVSLDLCMLLVHIDVLSSDSVNHQRCSLEIEVPWGLDPRHDGYFG